ncbi:MAG TPA: GDCCVxC domain-containing (seleno)protein [Candidatus Kryptobacter bacterium]|nr:GDCCVxC domain-containing (seleno)protein [Candidatus Kryptobacter bacterium]
MKTIRTDAILTCPECGHRQEAEMPTNACQHFFICINCKTVLSPKEGDCCVFCSYADTHCPPKQIESASGPQSE